MQLIVLILLHSLSSYAILNFEDATSPELVTSARALAMGNAYMCKVDDGWAAYYNPAGQGSVRGPQFHLTNIHLEANNGFFDVTSGRGAATDSITKYSDAFKAADLRDMLADNPGTISHAKGQVFPNLTFRYLTLGYIYTTQTRARLSDVNSDFEVAQRVDQGPVMNLSFSLFGGIVKFGLSGTYLTRQEFQDDIASGASVNISQSDYQKASMTYLVAGTRITLPIKFLPTFAAVYRNSGNGDWYNEELNGTPTDIPQTLDLGFSITPFTGRNARMHIEINYKDYNNFYEDVPTARKIVGGIEFDWGRSYFLRFGYGDGWGSGGIGVRNKSFVFDLTTYAVEASADGFREEEDRRYALSIASGF
jgi:hypothetical protein